MLNFVIPTLHKFDCGLLYFVALVGGHFGHRDRGGQHGRAGSLEAERICVGNA